MATLETDRLLFRDHELSDLEPYCQMESDEQYRWPQRVHDRAELERSFREAWLKPKQMGLLATVYKPDAQYIGRCGLYPYRTEDNAIVPGEACLAFYLARPHWNRGLATEAGRAFIEFGFNQLNLSRIEAGVDANNTASVRVIQKLGFVFVRSGEGGGNHWHMFELHNPSGAA